MGTWTLVFSSASSQEAEIVKGLLEEHDITAVVMDQRSSPYPHMGEAGVYVQRDDVLQALYLVRKHQDA